MSFIDNFILITILDSFFNSKKNKAPTAKVKYPIDYTLIIVFVILGLILYGIISLIIWAVKSYIGL